ncbi:uncharacterized protein LOC122331676 [Puntigrus tetrazona]|uniref:uncharacterized protein LOC122331676 n=1 Tax=Puntigrus tetrazona TaxID=1606681 RepID=UPI001C8AF68D|nr:uncharacterized protein LOC122331676 [Puntigrus tetrazona]
MQGIVPKNLLKGVDICGGKTQIYIIRSDIGCYMQTSNLNKGLDPTIFSLHPSCQNGDHYLADWNETFYVIKGDSFREVKDLSTDSEAKVLSLDENCVGGDFYFSAGGWFYIIFLAKGTFRQTTDLNKYTYGEEKSLRFNWFSGLYYWGQSKSFCFLKPFSKWGVEYNEGNSIADNSCFDTYSVHPSVVNFLPGGLSITKGPAFGRWENIKSASNDSKTAVTWHKKVVKKVGYSKEKITDITHNWKFGMSATIASGVLEGLIAKRQFSFSAEYGGSHVNTEKEIWHEATEVEEQLSFELKPNERVYLWQYNLGLGEESVLFCRDLKMDDVPNPPTEVPLPPAKP